MSSLPNPLHEALQRHAEHTAAYTASSRVTYREWAKRVRGQAEALSALGIERGDVLGILAQPSIESLSLILACLETGIIACPINLRWPADRVADALNTVDARWLVCDNASRSLAEEAAEPDTAIVPLEDLMLDETGKHPAVTSIEPDQPALVIFTSGSAGAPKAALLSAGNLYHNAVACNQVISYHAGDAWLLSLPIYHVSGIGILFRGILAGASVAIPPLGANLGDAIQDMAITHVSCVAAQVQRLLQSREGERALSRLKAIMLGGGPVPATLIRECINRDLPIHITYGMTETASQICTTRKGVPAHMLFTAGKAQEPDSVAIDDEGMIYVRGERLFLGYLAHGKVDRPVTEEGWFATGDLGRFDDDGNLIPLGRRDNMFVSGGENIHPETVERELGRIMGLEEAVVVPVPDAEFGQRPVAFVRMSGGETPDAEALAESIEDRVPRYAMPIAYYPWPDDLPEGMKISRAHLIERAQALRNA